MRRPQILDDLVAPAALSVDFLGLVHILDEIREIIGEVQLRVEIGVGLGHRHFNGAAHKHFKRLCPVAKNAAGENIDLDASLAPVEHLFGERFCPDVEIAVNRVYLAESPLVLRFSLCRCLSDRGDDAECENKCKNESQ